MSQSVDRAAEILIACSRAPHRLSELATTIGVHRSTVLRMLQTLEQHRFVRKLPDGAWAVGFGLTGLALESLESLDIRTVARPRMERLARDFGHTIHLAQISGHDIVYVDKVEGRGAVRMASRIGAVVPLHTAGVAKVILASLSADHRALLLSRVRFQRYTSSTIVAPGPFTAELRRVAAQGWAVDDGEFEEYLNCIAVPLRDHSGAVNSGISITALRAIEPLDRLRSHIPALQEIAAEVSRELGWDGARGAAVDAS